MENLNRNKTKRNISLLFRKSNTHFTFNIKEKLPHQIKTKNPFYYQIDSLMLSDHERSYIERFSLIISLPNTHTDTHIHTNVCLVCLQYSILVVFPEVTLTI